MIFFTSALQENFSIFKLIVSVFRSSNFSHSLHLHVFHLPAGNKQNFEKAARDRLKEELSKLMQQGWGFGSKLVSFKGYRPNDIDTTEYQIYGNHCNSDDSVTDDDSAAFSTLDKTDVMK